jgi:hypothetical protein
MRAQCLPGRRVRILDELGRATDVTIVRSLDVADAQDAFLIVVDADCRERAIRSSELIRASELAA